MDKFTINIHQSIVGVSPLGDGEPFVTGSSSCLASPLQVPYRFLVVRVGYKLQRRVTLYFFVHSYICKRSFFRPLLLLLLFPFIHCSTEIRSFFNRILLPNLYPQRRRSFLSYTTILFSLFPDTGYAPSPW